MIRRLGNEGVSAKSIIDIALKGQDSERQTCCSAGVEPPFGTNIKETLLSINNVQS